MKLYFENLKVITLAQVVRYAILLMNAVSFLFVLVYAIARPATAAAEAFSYVFLATLVLNVLHATVTKNRFGFWLIAGYGVGMLGVYGFNMLMGLQFFVHSANIGGAILSLLMLLAGAALLFSDCLMLGGRREKESGFAKIVRFLIVALGGVALIVFAILMYDAVYNFGYSVNEYTTTRAEFLLGFSAFCFACVLFRITLTEGSGKLKEKFQKSWAFLLIVAGLSGFTLVNYFTAVASVAGDIGAADHAFTAAFGAESLDGTPEMRQLRYSFADSFFGIETLGFAVDTDVVYASGAGLTLRFDRYVPRDQNAHKSVLVAIHGRGNDKGALSVPHRNKYFASKGYVVYDLQVGDFLEHNTGVDNTRKPTSAEMLPNIDKFFDYATKNNEIGADFNNVFLTGYSMGANLILKYGLSYPNKTAEFGVNIKGMVPCYPSYYAGDEGIDNFLNFVAKDSAPTLMLMGKNDGVINTDVVWETAKAYEKAGNPHYAPIEISYSGHGCDSSMTSRANQIFLFYMERFMTLFR